MAEDQREIIIRTLNRSILFHSKWRRIDWSIYVFTTVSALSFTIFATITAGIGESEIAAVCAGIGTLSVGLEKSLMFREKWKLHLSKEYQSSNLLLRFELEQMDTKTFLDTYQTLTESYTDELPIEGRGK